MQQGRVCTEPTKKGVSPIPSRMADTPFMTGQMCRYNPVARTRRTESARVLSLCSNRPVYAPRGADFGVPWNSLQWHREAPPAPIFLTSQVDVYVLQGLTYIRTTKRWIRLSWWDEFCCPCYWTHTPQLRCLCECLALLASSVTAISPGSELET